MGGEGDDVKGVQTGAIDELSVSRMYANDDDWRSEASCLVVSGAFLRLQVSAPCVPSRAWILGSDKSSQTRAPPLTLPLSSSFLLLLARAKPSPRCAHVSSAPTMPKNLPAITPDTGGFTPSRRKSEDELESNRASKKPRTRVR